MLFEHGFKLDKTLNWALIGLHDVTWKMVRALTNHFADPFVHKIITRVYDVVAM